MRRRRRDLAHCACALVASVVVLMPFAVGIGGLMPPLGPALHTNAGVWGWAAAGLPVSDRTVDIPGLDDQVTVGFDEAGVARVRGSGDDDLFQAQGYLHASFRLTQLDLSRRVATGRLSELMGAAGLDSDRAALQSGLLRTAEANWAEMPPDSPDAQALLAYSRGINAHLAELSASRQWPSLFAVTGVYPPDWTPVDTLAIQGLLAQSMSWSSGPLTYEILSSHVGEQQTMEWLPLYPVNEQRPYDTGPYTQLPAEPVDLSMNANAVVPTATTQSSGLSEAPSAHLRKRVSSSTVLDLMDRLAGPAMHTFEFPNSNAWAVNGPVVEGGGAMLAADPHLALTLPSYWYAVSLDGENTQVTGASLVGTPGVLIGHNGDIAWSLTNFQGQTTLYYRESTSDDRPEEYYWRGAWREMSQVQYTIPVRGRAPENFTVNLTVHGPIMDTSGESLAVTWMGNFRSRPFRALLGINKASNYSEFKSALEDWRAPAMNFVYADTSGTIAATVAGDIPQVAQGDPWLPLSGEGHADVTSTIPREALPEVVNPADNVIVSANQVPVEYDYPYYLGTSLNSFDPGYRAARLYELLEGHEALTAQDMEVLQRDVVDHLFQRLEPTITAALAEADLTPAEREAAAEITDFDGTMSLSSAGATVWWTLWTTLISNVYQPWWDDSAVPVERDRPGLEVSTRLSSLNQGLEHWILHDPHHPTFSAPGRAASDAQSAIESTFKQVVGQLSDDLGPDPKTWTWDRVHEREIVSLLGASALGHGPVPGDGNPLTVNSAMGGMTSAFGPSWRVVVTLGRDGITATGVYPGGQSEHPASPWYRNLITVWEAGEQLPLGVDSTSAGTSEWVLRPREDG